MLIRKENGDIVAAFSVIGPDMLTYLHGVLHDLLSVVEALPTPDAQQRARHVLALLLVAVEAPTAPIDSLP